MTGSILKLCLHLLLWCDIVNTEQVCLIPCQMISIVIYLLCDVIGFSITTDGVTTFINASSLDICYKPVNRPVIFDIPLPPGITKHWTYVSVFTILMVPNTSLLYSWIRLHSFYALETMMFWVHLLSKCYWVSWAVVYLSPSSTVTLWYVVFSTIIHLRHNRRLCADICALVLFWHCPDSMWSRVYEMERCPYVCPSVSPSMDAQQQARKCEECHFVGVCRKLNADLLYGHFGVLFCYCWQWYGFLYQ